MRRILTGIILLAILSGWTSAHGQERKPATAFVEVNIPELSELEARPIVITCHTELRGGGSRSADACMMMRLSDWLKMVKWIDKMEIELKRVCLALGNSVKRCKTEEPRK